MEIVLTEMSIKDFNDFITIATIAFAKNKTKNGEWEEKYSFERSKIVFAILLPDGLKTENHFFKHINVGNEKVGVMWFALEEENSEKIVFLYEITVFEEFRNQGFGSEAIRAFLQIAKKLQAARTLLHVFGFNIDAVRFYERLGFKITDYTMQQIC